MRFHHQTISLQCSLLNPLLKGACPSNDPALLPAALSDLHAAERRNGPPVSCSVLLGSSFNLRKPKADRFFIDAVLASPATGRELPFFLIEVLRLLAL